MNTFFTEHLLATASVVHMKIVQLNERVRCKKVLNADFLLLVFSNVFQIIFNLCI